MALQSNPSPVCDNIVQNVQRKAARLVDISVLTVHMCDWPLHAYTAMMLR